MPAARVEADAQSLGDRMRVQALAHEGEDAQLPGRQPAVRGHTALGPAPADLHPAEDRGQRAAVHEHPPVADGADPFEHRADRALLGDEPACAGRGRPGQDVRVRVPGEHQDARRFVDGPDAGDRLDAISVGQADVDEHDIGTGLLHGGEAFRDRARSPDAVEIRVGADRDRERLGKRQVIVDDQHARRLRALWPAHRPTPRSDVRHARLPFRIAAQPGHRPQPRYLIAQRISRARSLRRWPDLRRIDPRRVAGYPWSWRRPGRPCRGRMPRLRGLRDRTGR